MQRPLYWAGVFAVLAAAAVIAATLEGRVMTEGGQLAMADSWAYLMLAQSLAQGRGCLLDGVYFAVFPCGYPLSIALFSPSETLPALLSASKFANFAMAALSFVLIYRIRNEVLLATFLLLNPITLHIYQYTLSENLFFLAAAGCIFATDRIHAGRRVIAYQLLLTLFLLVGTSSRYFFGPYLAVLFFATPLAYGLRTAIATLAPYAIAAAAFGAYLAFNIHELGVATGEHRLPAPETLQVLVVAFLKVSLLCAAILAVWLALFLAVAHILGRRADAQPAFADIRYLVYTAAIGAGYLALTFILRTRAFYDLYSTRLVEFGYVLLLSAAVCLLLRGCRPSPYPVAALVLLGTVSVTMGWVPEVKAWLFAHLPFLAL